MTTSHGGGRDSAVPAAPTALAAPHTRHPPCVPVGAGHPRVLHCPTVLWLRHPWDHCPGCPHTWWLLGTAPGRVGSRERREADGQSSDGDGRECAEATLPPGTGTTGHRHVVEGTDSLGCSHPPPRLLSELGHCDKPPDGPRGAGTHGKPQHATDTRHHHAKHTQTHGEGTRGSDGDTHTHTRDGTQEGPERPRQLGRQN